MLYSAVQVLTGNMLIYANASLFHRYIHCTLPFFRTALCGDHIARLLFPIPSQLHTPLLSQHKGTWRLGGALINVTDKQRHNSISGSLHCLNQPHIVLIHVLLPPPRPPSVETYLALKHCISVYSPSTNQIPEPFHPGAFIHPVEYSPLTTGTDTDRCHRLKDMQRNNRTDPALCEEKKTQLRHDCLPKGSGSLSHPWQKDREMGSRNRAAGRGGCLSCGSRTEGLD